MKREFNESEKTLTFEERFRNGDVQTFKRMFTRTQEGLKSKATALEIGDVDGYLIEAYKDVFNMRKSFKPDKAGFDEWFEAVTDKSAVKYKKHLSKSEGDEDATEADGSRDVWGEIEVYITDPKRKPFAALTELFKQSTFRKGAVVCACALVFVIALAAVLSTPSNASSVVVKKNATNTGSEAETEDGSETDETSIINASSTSESSAEDADVEADETDEASSISDTDETASDADGEEDEVTDDEESSSGSGTGNTSSSSSSGSSSSGSSSKSQASGSGSSSSSSSSSSKSSTSSSSSSSKSSNGSSSSSSSGSSSSSHTHNWVAQYTTVHHDAVTKTETVVVQEAYTEEVKATRYVCNKCSAYYEDGNEILYHTLTVCGGGYSSKKVVVDTIYHEAETQEVTTVVQEAYDEQVLSGYKCSSCGATK